MARSFLSRHCIPLPQEEPLEPDQLRQLGGKAAALMQLAMENLPVLPGVVLLPSAFERARPAPPPGSDAGASAQPFPHQLEATVKRELLAALDDLILRMINRPAPSSGGNTGRFQERRWAVRSSGRGEDGSVASYAGQFLSRLNVADADLEEAILAVWHSGSGAALASYRQSRGLVDDGGNARTLQVPAVLIQPMLQPRFAGVAFSADPVSGRRGVTLVQAVAGIAADLVAGREEGESWRLDREGRVLEHRPASRSPAARHPQADAGAADHDRTSAPSPGATTALAEEDARRIAALTRRLGHHRGRPQDLEWALMADGTLWLLQSRPISTLARLNDPDGRLALWDNSNIVESYSGISTPLTFSFARKAYSEVYAQFCRFMGVEETRIRHNRAVFGSMIGFLEGRIYYNLLSWYRVLALLPGYRLNARFLEQMLGVKHRLSAAQMEQIRRQQRCEADSEPCPRWQEGPRLIRSLFGLVANALTLRRRSRSFRRRLDRVLLNPAQLDALADARPDELVSLYRRIEAELLSHWDAPLINDFYAMIFYGTLRHLSRRWCSEQEASALHDWIAGDASVISAEPPRRIRAMALLLLRRPELIDVLRNGQAPAQRRALASCPELETEVERYLDDFGDRCLEELKLETLTLREDPLPLLRSIGAMATRLQQDPGIHPHPPSAEPPAAGDTCAPLLPGHPLRRLVLRWLQRRTRALVSNRENLRFERTRVFGLARRLLLELGRHLAELELLERPEDVLFLEVEEALGIVEGNGSSSDLRGLVAVRRAAWQRQRQQPPLPRRLETHGLPCLDTATLVSAPPEGEGGLPPDAGSGWQGTGCAPGRVRARVSLVRDPRLWLETPADQRGGCPILVAGSTDPGWVLLFPHAAGLLVERGSVLSHVAIVARELGLPMVSDLGGITGHLREGDIVEMDGRSGTVIRVEDSAMAAVEAPVP